MKRLFFYCLIVLLVGSCSYAISERYRERAMREISFSQIQKNPDAYLNEIFILGGTIVETKNTKEGTEIEVLQNPIDSYGGIEDRDVSQGRFILLSSRHLDPLIYKNGRTITVAGKLVGSRTQKLGETEYRYPVIDAEEIHLWKEEIYGPPYYYYDPFYYYYPYPYWYDPFWRGSYFYPW
jgi:outer membrane lipoprotein